MTDRIEIEFTDKESRQVQSALQRLGRALPGFDAHLEHGDLHIDEAPDVLLSLEQKLEDEADDDFKNRHDKAAATRAKNKVYDERHRIIEERERDDEEGEEVSNPSSCDTSRATRKTEIVARFKKERHGNGEEIGANELPTEWTHPRAERGESWEGAQVLGLHRALEMIDDGEDVRDDWFQGGKGYDALQLLVVDGKSGDSGPLSYPAVTDKDVEMLHTIDLDDLDWALTEIAIALDEEGEPVEFDEMGFAEDRWWDGLVNEVIERLINRSETQSFDAAEIDWRSLSNVHFDKVA